MSIDAFRSLPELIEKLRSEGYDALRDMLQGEMGLLISEKGKTIPPADFFPLWELNENLDLVAQRDFAAIKARRPRNWLPRRRER